MPKRSLRNCWMYVADGTADVSAGDMTGNYVEVTVGEGNIQWTEAKGIEYQLDRGRIIDVDTVNDIDLVVGTVVEGDQAPMEVSFDLRFEYYTADGTINPVEALKGVKPHYYDNVIDSTTARQAEVLSTGDLGDWVYADTEDPCAPWSVNLFVKFDPGCGDYTGTTEWLKFPVFRWDQIQCNLNDGQIACSGKCQAIRPSVMVAGDSTWT